MTKVSFIVPAYNVENYIEECIDSIIAQQVTSDVQLEIICVNDGSTDSTKEKLEKYANLDFVKIIHQENKGLSAARNAALKEVTGDLIAFVDGDDFIDSTVAYNASLMMQKLNNADVYCYNFELQYDDKNYPEFRKKKDAEYYTLKNSGFTEIDLEEMLHVNVSVCGKVFKKSLLDECKIKFHEGLNYEDFAFVWEYYPHCKNAYFDKYTNYHYRRRNDSIMAKTFNDMNVDDICDHLRIFNEILNYYVAHNLAIKYDMILIELFKYCYKFCKKFTLEKHHNKVMLQALNSLKLKGD